MAFWGDKAQTSTRRPECASGIIRGLRDAAGAAVMGRITATRRRCRRCLAVAATLARKLRHNPYYSILQNETSRGVPDWRAPREAGTGGTRCGAAARDPAAPYSATAAAIKPHLSVNRIYLYHYISSTKLARRGRPRAAPVVAHVMLASTRVAPTCCQRVQLTRPCT